MKNYLYTGTCIIFCWLVLPGCDKYLDNVPKGQTILTSVTDYDKWLNDANNAGAGDVPGLNYLTDYVDYPSTPNPPLSSDDLMYTWQPQFEKSILSNPIFWENHYAGINEFNTVLNGIDKATGGTAEQKNSLKAEALLGRDYEYFYLVNEYGKEYDSTTANTDLAVPFVTSSDISNPVPARSTVAAVYDSIIGDLNAALPNLPQDNSHNRFRGSVGAAYSLLARVYFYARDYKDAEKNALLALQSPNTAMIDLNNTFVIPSGVYADQLLGIRQDGIYARISTLDVTPSLDFMRSFEANDLRVHTFYYNDDGYTYTQRSATQYAPQYTNLYFSFVNMGTTVQEMKLIVAECAARSNDLATALQQLNDVRVNRFPTASFTPFQSSSQDSVFQAVLTERMHELPFFGLRWFDMRRLDKENRMGTVTRYDAQGNIVATLAPHSIRYAFQIPDIVLGYNPGMQQNP